MEIEKFIENYREAFGEAALVCVVRHYAHRHSYVFHMLEPGIPKRSAGVFLKVCKRFVPAIRLV